MFWIFVAALVVYGVGETMFGNWGTTLLVSKGVSATSANDGLAEGPGPRGWRRGWMPLLEVTQPVSDGFLNRRSMAPRDPQCSLNDQSVGSLQSRL